MKCSRFVTLTLLIGMTLTVFSVCSTPDDQKQSHSTPSKLKPVTPTSEVAIFNAACIVMKPTAEAHVEVPIVNGEPDFEHAKVIGPVAFGLNSDAKGCEMTLEVRRSS